MVNKVILIGNLGQDPELRNTAGGNAVCTLRLATAERRKGPDGNWTDHTEWHSVVTWGRDAENVAKYCRKGKQIYVEGRLQTRKWQDKTGADRYSTEVVADTVRFLGGKDGASHEEPRGRGDDRPANSGRSQGSHAPSDEDIPF